MRIVMMGTGAFAAPIFKKLLVSQHDVVELLTRPTPPARGRKKPPVNPMRLIAESENIPVFAPPSVNDQESLDRLATLAADLFVVCDYGRILSNEALSRARLGGVNLHGSLLPKYRGAAPVNWALFHGETETGVTVIHMTPQLDGGPCLKKVSTKIDSEETAIELEERLAQLGVAATLDAIALLDRWDGASPLGERQNNTQATRAPRLTKEDGRIDWRRTAEEIKNQFRAFQPWPGAYTSFEDRKGQTHRLIIHQLRIVTEHEGEKPPPPSPGEVVEMGPETLALATGRGVVFLERVQPAGKRAMNIAEFLRGHAFQIGAVFGS